MKLSSARAQVHPAQIERKHKLFVCLWPPSAGLCRPSPHSALSGCRQSHHWSEKPDLVRS